MSDGTAGPQGPINRAAENALLKLVARICMVAMIPIGAYIGGKLWDKLDKTNESTIRLEQSMQNIVTFQIPAIQLNTDGRFNAQAERITDQGNRIGKLEDWRNSFNARGNP